MRDTVGLGEASRDSTGFCAMEEGLISSGGRKLMFPLLTSPGPDLTRIAVSLQSSNRRIKPRLVWRNGTLLASPVVHGVTGHFSSCVWYLRVSPDDTRGCQCPFLLCLHQKGYLQRGVRALGSYQERTGKLGSFGMCHHPRGYVSNILVRPASS